MNKSNSRCQLALKPLDEDVSIEAEFTLLQKLRNASNHLDLADGADEHVEGIRSVDVHGIDRMAFDLTDVRDDNWEDEAEKTEENHADADYQVNFLLVNCFVL
jgi:hypothetical protein